ncbi:MAG: hypothetical protein A2X19_06630 [Bacteroidetes bacterium GWE2_39_28]|nr:MAG: hypothetical protein A2X19_06630 [Bacteroidetes bacterium GWE2_39_28]OFY14302.1 MAG: hypothetical protein A2X16_09575 [Bacteroidetes bacterium GWF2_39_10]OFZ09668.1 MAG: hypothetical protein A2465_00075 [Bacteroidetes bacterium RIFOXYC2_FULL_39_11]HCT94525.1 hypothetical protein [Rikenellaceae bacterium]
MKTIKEFNSFRVFRVLKVTNWVIVFLSLFVILSLFGTAGCASLSKDQIKAIDTYTASCDSFSKHPTLLFEEIAQIRAERAFWYSSSLSDPELRVSELNSVYGAYVKDMSLAKKAGVSVEILLTYKRALKVLAGKARWEDAGREFRSLGRTLDSLVRKFNDLGFVEALPLGIGKSAGRVVGYTAEVLNKRAQAKSVRGFVIQGDTLVNAVTEVLCEVLASPSVNLLIENEKRGVEQNYITYLKATKPDKPALSVSQLIPTSSVSQNESTSSVNQTKPFSIISQNEPTSSVNQTKPSSTINQNEQASTINQTIPNLSVNHITLASGANQLEPASTVTQTKPSSSINQNEQTSTINQHEQASTINQTIPNLSVNHIASDGYIHDKRYFELKGRAEELTSRKAGIISAIKHLARAHSKLTTELQKGKEVADFWEELLEFNKELEALEKGLKSIKF